MGNTDTPTPKLSHTLIILEEGPYLVDLEVSYEILSFLTYCQNISTTLMEMATMISDNDHNICENLCGMQTKLSGISFIQRYM